MMVVMAIFGVLIYNIHAALLRLAVLTSWLACNVQACGFMQERGAAFNHSLSLKVLLLAYLIPVWIPLTNLFGHFSDGFSPLLLNTGETGGFRNSIWGWWWWDHRIVNISEGRWDLSFYVEDIKNENVCDFSFPKHLVQWGPHRTESTIDKIGRADNFPKWL